MMVDRCGHNLQKGQAVDLSFNGMAVGRIVDIKDGGGIIVPGQPQRSPSMILVQVLMSMEADARGVVNGVYVIGNPTTDEPSVGMGTVQPSGDHNRSHENERREKRRLSIFGHRDKGNGETGKKDES